MTLIVIIDEPNIAEYVMDEIGNKAIIIIKPTKSVGLRCLFGPLYHKSGGNLSLSAETIVKI